MALAILSLFAHLYQSVAFLMNVENSLDKYPSPTLAWTNKPSTDSERSWLIRVQNSSLCFCISLLILSRSLNNFVLSALIICAYIADLRLLQPFVNSHYMKLRLHLSIAVSLLLALSGWVAS
jgi:hypothetical protein